MGAFAPEATKSRTSGQFSFGREEKLAGREEKLAQVVAEGRESCDKEGVKDGYGDGTEHLPRQIGPSPLRLFVHGVRGVVSAPSSALSGGQR